MTRMLVLVPITFVSLTAPAAAQPATDPSAREVVERAVEAHGGLDRWRAAGQVTFFLTLERADRPPELIVLGFPTSGSLDVEAILQGRYMTYDDGETAVWDIHGQPSDDDADHDDDAYYLPTLTYIWSLPFKLLDDGVHLERLDDISREGRPLRRVLVTFGEGVGEYPEDWYRYDLDVETGRLVRVLFEEHDPRNQAFIWLEFEGTTEVGDLILPERWVYYASDAEGQRGDLSKVVTLVGVRTGHRLAGRAQPAN